MNRTLETFKNHTLKGQLCKIDITQSTYCIQAVWNKLHNERRCAISNLLSNDVVLGYPLYIDVTLKLLKRLTEGINLVIQLVKHRITSRGVARAARMCTQNARVKRYNVCGAIWEYFHDI